MDLNPNDLDEVGSTLGHKLLEESVSSATSWHGEDSHIAIDLRSRERVNKKRRISKEKGNETIIDLTLPESRRSDISTSYNKQINEQQQSRIEKTAENWVFSVQESMTPMPPIQKSAECSSDALFYDDNFPPAPASIDGRRGATKSSSNSAVGSSANLFPKCRCKPPRISKSVCVSKPGPNKGRYFWGCSKPKKFRCGFFRWASGEPHTKQALTLRWMRTVSQSDRFVLNRGGRFMPTDVLQGRVGDCWFLSAICVVAERRDLLDRIFAPTLKSNLARSRRLQPFSSSSTQSELTRLDSVSTSRISVNLFTAGQWTCITIDDFLPVIDKESERHKLTKSKVNSHSAEVSKLEPTRLSSTSTVSTTFAFAKEGKGGVCWVPLLEKAFAKAQGSYQAISGGEVSEGMEALSGYPTEEIDFNSKNFCSDEVWIRMLSFAEAGFPMGAGTSSSGLGVVGNHAYSVLDVQELHGFVIGEQKKLTSYFKQAGSNLTNNDVNGLGGYVGSRNKSPEHAEGLRLLKIRNPWGKKEWEGQFGRLSSTWTRRLRSQLDNTRKNDGSFWIPWHDFLQRFSNVDVLKAHKGWHMSTFNLLRDSKPGVSVVSLKLRILEPTWLYVSLYTMELRKRTTKSEFHVPMSLLIIKESLSKSRSSSTRHTVKKRNFMPVKLHLVGQRPSSHVELMLSDVEATYHIILLARPYNSEQTKDFKSHRSLPLIIRIFSSIPVSTCLNSDDAFRVGPSEQTMTSCLQQSLYQDQSISCSPIQASPKPFQTNVITSLGAEGLQLILVRGLGASMICATNTETSNYIVSVAFRRNAPNQREKVEFLWAEDCLPVDLQDFRNSASSSNPGSGSSNGDVILVDINGKVLVDDDQHFPIRKVIVPKLSRRIIAFGVSLSKYTDTESHALKIIGVRSKPIDDHCSILCSWMYKPINLF